MILASPIYKTCDSAKSFTHYIAQSQRQSFFDSLSTMNFYSFLMDGSTNSRNVEDELVLIQYCTQDAVKVHGRQTVEETLALTLSDVVSEALG